MQISLIIIHSFWKKIVLQDSDTEKSDGELVVDDTNEVSNIPVNYKWPTFAY